MRADRLISIVMMLQVHEKMTAEELSRELEVSQRTIYRDITALNIAGIPIYTDRGPGGGIALVESYRTTLTGINEEEARALFMLSIPDAINDLGLGPKLKTALLKFAAALPEGQRTMMERIQRRIYLDPSVWNPSEDSTAHLGLIHQAIWQDRRIKLIYLGSFDTRIEIEITPLGLVSKQNLWYLVGTTEGYLRVIKVKDILEVRIQNHGFIRDEDFDLVSTWMNWCKDYKDHQPVYQARIKVSPELKQRLGIYIGENNRFKVLDSPSGVKTDWTEVVIGFDSFFQARGCILNMGRAAQVLVPDTLRLSIIDYAEQIVDFYSGSL